MRVAEMDDPVDFDVCNDAEGSDEATVTWIEDVAFEEVELAVEVSAETVEVNGEQVELLGAPAVVLPERVGQSGCITEYDASGGCLPALEIGAGCIPGYTLPERTLPGTELPDGTVVEELKQSLVTVAPIEIPGVTADRVCQDDEDAEAGDTVWSASRWGENADGCDRTPTMRLDTFSSDTMSIDTVRVDTYKIAGSEHTEYSEDDEVTSYTTEADVLFDNDEYELRVDAEPGMQVIADDIVEREDDYLIEVEGHTDDLPTSVYDNNCELSEMRAESVVDWVVDNSGVGEDIMSAEGLGEDYPRVDNDSDDARQQNRRVVIMVAPADGRDPEVEHEIEGAQE